MVVTTRVITLYEQSSNLIHCNLAAALMFVHSFIKCPLREKEKTLIKDQLDGLESYCSGNTPLNYVFDRYIATKFDLKQNTRTNYKYVYDHCVRDTFGRRNITEIKYSDVKFFYFSLINECGLKTNTLDTIHTVLHPTFDMAVRDGVIRNNPSNGVMAEIKKNCGKN